MDPWVRKIPRRRKRQSTLLFLRREPHGQRALVDYSPWVTESRTGLKRVSTHMHAKVDLNTRLGGFPGVPAVKNMLPMQGSQVPSLVVN